MTESDFFKSICAHMSSAMYLLFQSILPTFQIHWISCMIICSNALRVQCSSNVRQHVSFNQRWFNRTCVVSEPDEATSVPVPPPILPPSRCQTLTSFAVGLSDSCGPNYTLACVIPYTLLYTMYTTHACKYCESFSSLSPTCTSKYA